MVSNGTDAAAFHGLASNTALPPADRLAMALQALGWYEAEVERLGNDLEALASHDAATDVDNRNLRAEVESLRRQVAQQRQLANDLADERLGPALAESARLAGRERDVIEAAKAYERAWDVYANPFINPGLTEEERILAKAAAHKALLDAVRKSTGVDALSQPVAEDTD
jgi:hypothetical protein